MSKQIIYVEATKQFIIDGQTINESDLSIEEVKKYKTIAESQKLLVGDSKTIDGDERLLV